MDDEIIKFIEGRIRMIGMGLVDDEYHNKDLYHFNRGQMRALELILRDFGNK